MRILQSIVLALLCILGPGQASHDIVKDHKKNVLCKTCICETRDLCNDVMTEYFCTYPDELKVDVSAIYEGLRENASQRERTLKCYETFPRLHSNPEYILSFYADEFITEHCKAPPDYKMNADVYSSRLTLSKAEDRSLLEAESPQEQHISTIYEVEFNVEFNLNVQCTMLLGSAAEEIADQSAIQAFDLDIIPDAAAVCVSGKSFRQLRQANEYGMQINYKLRTNDKVGLSVLQESINTAKRSGVIEQSVRLGFDTYYPEVTLSSFSYSEPVVRNEDGTIVAFPPASPPSPRAPESPSDDNDISASGRMAALGVTLGVGASIISGAAGFLIAKKKYGNGRTELSSDPVAA